MSPSSSRSDAFGYLVARGPVAEATSATAWLQAMLDAEAALALAEADVGDIPADAARAVADACRIDRFDVDGVLDEAALGGNAVIPLVAHLRQLVGPDAAGFVHRHATSQDIVDAATAVVVRRSAEVVADALLTAAKSVASIGEQHGAAAMISRTLGQYAVPSTFAAVTGRWREGLAQASAAIAGTDRMRVVLGGPSGDGTSYGEHRAEIAERFARRLRLRAGSRSAGHPQRGAPAEVAGAWGLAAAAVAKVALDVVLLAQSDIGEVSEEAEGAGGSSSMAHKHNPIAAVCARAAAMQAPGLVSTLLHAAGGHELERAAGAWHAEWPALDQLLRVTGSATDWLQTSLDRLVVHPDRMAANLARGGPPAMTGLHVTETGLRDGPVVVWLGSLGTTVAMWEPQMAWFGGRARNVLVDHPGHGASPSPTGPLTIESLAERVVAELDRLGIGRAHVVGLSIGAMAAMALAAHHSARLERMALLCTSAQLGPAAAWYERATTVRAEGTGAIATSVVGRWLTPDYAEAHPAEVSTLRQMVSAVEREGYASCCEAIATMDLRAVLPGVTAPTLVVAGALDPATPVEHGELIAALIPGATVEIVEAAHLASWELPDRINALLADHLLEDR